ncbi:MAG: LysM peptidoglycan-binding domain-containing protein [Dermatophilaceae bacterium]|nr:LysM peptidoglycan-binding domain-containing protein [Dermatophilaceae bacterium]NUQ32277.1 LysM peptidoglycan-binding domain-containing protein [Dermatophilaceae bacterium]
MSAIVLEAVRQQQASEPRPAARPHLVLVPTGRDAVRAARAAQPPLRLTRFGRLVVALLVAAVVSLLAVGLVGQLASASGGSRTVTVTAGQTLSGIAARELPRLSLSDGVVALQVANSLSSTEIHVGQQLVIPGR